MSLEDVMREVAILKKVRTHPNVVRLVDSFSSRHHYYLVMELYRAYCILLPLTESFDLIDVGAVIC